MKIFKKVELSEYIGQDITIERYHCFNDYMVSRLSYLYDSALDKGIKLRYNKQDLLDYIKKQKESLLSEPMTKEEIDKQFDKNQRKRLIKRCALGFNTFLLLYASHVASKDYYIHESANVENSYGIISELSNDFDNDGILEINTSILDYIDEYKKPTDNTFYKNSNLFYNMSSDLRVADNISFMVALDQMNIDVIQIDDIVYSKTGKVTKISYKKDGEEKAVATSKTFSNNEEVLNYLNNINNNGIKSSYEIIDKVEMDAEKLESIPSIYKNKETDKVTLKYPSNTKSKALKLIYNIYDQD